MVMVNGTFLFVKLLANHASGCYLFCLNRKSPDLKSINKFLIVSLLIALSFNIQRSGFGITSRFHLVLKDCGIAVFANFFLRYCGVQNPPMSITPSIIKTKCKVNRIHCVTLPASFCFRFLLHSQSQICKLTTLSLHLFCIEVCGIEITSG